MMKKSYRKLIWGSVLCCTLAATIFVSYLGRQEAQLSFSASDREGSAATTSRHTVLRYPDFSAAPVAIDAGKGPMNAITLKHAIALVAGRQLHIFAVRSLAELYPDGTSMRYEILYDASSTVRRIELGSGGVISDVPVTVHAPVYLPMPQRFPDSKEALAQLVANPYFAHAHIVGIAFYIDEGSKHWGYVLRTDMGDISIPL